MNEWRDEIKKRRKDEDMRIEGRVSKVAVIVIIKFAHLNHFMMWNKIGG